MTGNGGFYNGDNTRISYPEADRIVEEYIEARGRQKERVTSRDVLNWSEVPDVRHNQKRIHGALSVLCEETDEDWAGRTVFKVNDTNRS